MGQSVSCSNVSFCADAPCGAIEKQGAAHSDGARKSLPLLLGDGVRRTPDDRPARFGVKRLVEAVASAAESPRRLLQDRLGDPASWCDAEVSEDAEGLADDDLEESRRWRDAALRVAGLLPEACVVPADDGAPAAEPCYDFDDDLEAAAQQLDDHSCLEFGAAHWRLESVPEEEEGTVSCSAGSRSNTSRSAAKPASSPVGEGSAPRQVGAGLFDPWQLGQEEQPSAGLVINALPPPLQVRSRASSASSASGSPPRRCPSAESGTPQQRFGSGSSGSRDPFEPLACSPAAAKRVAEAEPLWSLPGLPPAETEEDVEERERIKAYLAANGFPGPKAGRRRLGRTTYPLHAAVRGGDAEMVALLLRWGADPAQTDSSGRTPLELAFQRDRRGSLAMAIDALVAAGAQEDGRAPPL